MFDKYGRITCVECGGSMRVSKATLAEVIFDCYNQQCHHKVTITWPSQPPPNTEPHIVALAA